VRTPRIGVLCTQVRLEEKLIFEALRKRGVPFERVDVRELVLELGGDGRDSSRGIAGRYDVVLMRCLSHSRAMHAARALEARGVRTVNPSAVIETCGDKVLTTLALFEHGLPSPRTALAFSEAAGLEAVERIGYPAVLKPPIGSWGRLMAKANDREAAEALLEHQAALNRMDEAPFYVQEYVNKPGRDLRTLVVGGRTVYAITRSSEHWITNTARGGQAASLEVSEEIDRLSCAAAAAVGGEIVAVDLLENADGALLVNEVNHTPEFHGAAEATGLDIAGSMVDYLIHVARERV
jgi:[lysine-biosynthesis-protein LysW]--L-2-aminoadipate ligase